MIAHPNQDDVDREVDVEPGHEVDASHDIVLRSRMPVWPWFLALGLAVVVLGLALVVLATGTGHQQVATPPLDQSRPKVATSMPAPPAPSVVPALSEADKNRLTQAMRGETVHAERPAPTHLDVAVAALATPSASDVSPVPPAKPIPAPHDVAPGIVSDDAAPPALPIEQSILSPTLTADAEATSRRKPVRLAWDAVASGTQEQVTAIDRAGTLVEQGNVPMARDVLRPVATAGNAVAAYALGQTYDPSMLQMWQDTSAVPDVRQARTYYRQAQVAGIEAAAARLAALR